MKQFRIGLYIVAAFGTIASLSSCVSEGNNTGIEYAPNMYVSEAYEAYTQTEEMTYNEQYGGMTMRPPVKGTIARGQLDYYQYPEGYEAAAAWTNPLPRTEANVDKGMALFNTYCWHCHGKSGKNDGPVVKNSEYPSPPWTGYDSDYIKNLPDGKIFHTITYGKGIMGPHGSVLSPTERWELVYYVRKLSLGDAFTTVPEGKTIQEMVNMADTAAVAGEPTGEAAEAAE